MKYRIIRIVCAVCAVVFIAVTALSGKTTKLTAAELGEKLSETADLSELTQRDNLYFKKTFGVAAENYDGIYYYSSTDVMNVDELLVVKFTDSASAQALKEVIESYGSDKYDTFAQYDQAAADKLSRRALVSIDNALMYYVGDSPDEVTDAFRKAIK